VSGVLLVLDNRDSFTFNLVQALRVLTPEVLVRRSAAISLPEVEALAPERILIGPGPGGPDGAGCSLDVARAQPCGAPILGVCLGHQVLATAFGGRVVRAPAPVHGHAVPITHDGRGLFEGLDQPLTVARYHSLVVEEASLPEELEVSARSAEGLVMGLRHKQLPLESVQFHPESILSEGTSRLFANFLALRP
jgi:anthranilate synthase component 2